jgi:4a-hydroxytetrahydrobiopterin dehydratase
MVSLEVWLKRGIFMGAQCDLVNKKCVPCKGGVPPLKGEPLKELQKQLGDGWKVVEEHHLEKEFAFRNFKEALAFTNRVGEVAEQEGHHPDIFLSWGKVKIQLWTHKIDGLTESDFIMAAKCDQCFKPL